MSALPDVPALESDSDSEGEVEDSLEPPSEEQAKVSRLCREGGAALSHFLLALTFSPCEVYYRFSNWKRRRGAPQLGHTGIYYAFHPHLSESGKRHVKERSRPSKIERSSKLVKTPSRSKGY